MTDPETGSTAGSESGSEMENEFGEGPVIRDKRRLDPKTGKVREAYGAEPFDQIVQGIVSPPVTGEEVVVTGEPVVPESELVKAQDRAAEHLADLQRLQAEYVNYRRRVERDREAVRDLAVASVLEALLPVLDDVHLARQHGDLVDGPFAAIAEKLETILTRYGLERFGAVGETFDPTVHEALIHTEDELAPEATDTTVVLVIQPGYRTKDRVVRPARVAVADPR